MPATEAREFAKLRRQRKLLIAIATCVMSLAVLAVPRKIAAYRELKRANEELTKLQRWIVQDQHLVTNVQLKIINIQLALQRRQSR